MHFSLFSEYLACLWGGEKRQSRWGDRPSVQRREAVGRVWVCAQAALGPASGRRDGSGTLEILLGGNLCHSWDLVSRHLAATIRLVKCGFKETFWHFGVYASLWFTFGRNQKKPVKCENTFTKETWNGLQKVSRNVKWFLEIKYLKGTAGNLWTFMFCVDSQECLQF